MEKRKASGPVEEPMSLVIPVMPAEMSLVIPVMPAESDAEIEGEEVRLRISGGEMKGITEAPHYIENEKDPVLKELRSLNPLSSWRCIYRVPKRLRQGNEKAYTPQVVSIGPLHHGEEPLKGMEEHKLRYLRSFLDRTGVSFCDYIQMIKNQEGRLRGFYAESVEFGSDEFVRIVLVDAAFVIELLLRYYDKKYGGEDDYIFNNPRMLWDVRPDLRLIENQLPFFILQDLFRFFSSSSLSLLDISHKFFKGEIDSKGKEENFKNISNGDVQHFVDLIRILYGQLKSKTRANITVTDTPNVTELHQAGVKFKEGKGSSLFDIKFSHGILEIPKLTVDDTTELTLRNLLAFEQCHRREEDYLANYVFLMKRLVKTPEDVQLLVDKEIIDNWLGDTHKISTLLHDLGTGMMVDHHYYAPLCKELKDYREKLWHGWMVILKQNYFNTPWASISVVAAVILLILTVIQTACSYKSVPLF
ncbi:hypothetical protein ACFX13_017242 [Malus domestica]